MLMVMMLMLVLPCNNVKKTISDIQLLQLTIHYCYSHLFLTNPCNQKVNYVLLPDKKTQKNCCFFQKFHDAEIFWNRDALPVKQASATL